MVIASHSYDLSTEEPRSLPIHLIPPVLHSVHRWRKAATGSRVEGFAGLGLAERFVHCTCAWFLRQVPNQDGVPALGLKEMGLRQRRGNTIAVVVGLSHKTGHKRKKQPDGELALTARMRIQRLCH